MTITTPCVKRCALDEASGLCLGCGRRIGEIAAWGTLTEAERRAILADLPARRAGRPDGPVPGAAGRR